MALTAILSSSQLILDWNLTPCLLMTVLDLGWIEKKMRQWESWAQNAFELVKQIRWSPGVSPWHKRPPARPLAYPTKNIRSDAA